MTKRILFLITIILSFTGIIILVRQPCKTSSARQANAVAPDSPSSSTQQSNTTPPSQASTPSPASSQNSQQTLSNHLDKIHSLTISPTVRTIIGLDGNAGSRDQRMNALRRLNRTITPEDVKALVWFLDVHSSGQTNLPPAQMNALKNDVLDVLLRQDTHVEGLATELVRMFNDEQHDIMWRDYCIQYLATCYVQTQSAADTQTNAPINSATATGTDPQAIESAYWQAIKQKDTTIAGTALLGLIQLTGYTNRAAFDTNKIGTAAVSLATDPMTSEPSRITAMRICAMMNRTDVLPTARTVAQTGETIPLRMSAIATLGDLGKSDDRELLESLARDSEKRIQTIAKSAIQKLQKRLENAK